MSLQVEKNLNTQQTTTELKSVATTSSVQQNVPMVDTSKIELNVDKYKSDSSNTQTNETNNDTSSLNKVYKTFERQIAECGLSIQEAMKENFLAKVTGKTNDQLTKLDKKEIVKLIGEINCKIEFAHMITKSKKITINDVLEATVRFNLMKNRYTEEDMQEIIKETNSNRMKRKEIHELINGTGIEDFIEKYYPAVKKAGGFNKLSDEQKVHYMNRFFSGHKFKSPKEQFRFFEKLLANSSPENRELMVGVIKSLNEANRLKASEDWLDTFLTEEEKSKKISKRIKDGILNPNNITMGSVEKYPEGNKYNKPMNKEEAALLSAEFAKYMDKDAAKIHQEKTEKLKKDIFAKQQAYKVVLQKVQNGKSLTKEETKLLNEYNLLKELGYNIDAEYDALTGTISGTIVGYSINEALQEVLEGHDKTIAEELIAESNKSNQALSKQYGINFDKDVDNSINALINDIAENHPEILGELSKEDFIAQVKDTINKATEGSFYENIGETPKTENKTVEPVQNKVSVTNEKQATSIGFANQKSIDVTTRPEELTQKIYNLPTQKEDTKTEEKNKPIEKCLTIEDYAKSNEKWDFYDAADRFGYFSTIAYALKLNKNDKAHRAAIKAFANNKNTQDDTVKKIGLSQELLQVICNSVLESLKGVTLATTKMTNDLEKAIKEHEEKKS